MFDKIEHNTIINLGEQSPYIEKNEGTVVYNTIPEKPSLSKEELLSNIISASVDLSKYDNTFQGKIHIDRKETKDIFNWIEKEIDEKESNIALLAGNAGLGKSVVLRDLFELLHKNNIPALGIKADKLLNINSLNDIETELNLKDNIPSILQCLTNSYPIAVLLIDQIDALSQSLSSNRNAINSYDRLIKQLENYSNIRIIISCRTYDLDYDPVLRSYNSKNIFKLSLLDLEEVNKVLVETGIKINDNNARLKEFLRIPLHLNLFFKVGLNKQFDDNISLQKLYDEIWKEYIENCKGLDSVVVINLLTNIAEKMHEQQRIVVDKRSFDLYSKEIHYLLHNDLLNESENKIQFIHQTFFDYIYARTFITSGKNISTWLNNAHQGLFIRSQVKQIFAYLRDLDPETYLRELKKILSDVNYRFHLKLLLISDIGFYNNPLMQEIKFVKDYIMKSSLLFRIFLESIQSSEWFKFIITQSEFKKLLTVKYEKIESVIINLCIRVAWQDAQIVIDFLSELPTKIKLIENVLIHIPDTEVSLTYELYNKTSSEWSGGIRECRYYLEKVLKSDPDFVIAELKKDFDKNILNISWFNYNYISDGSDGLHIYNKLFKLYPDKSIPHFLYVLEKSIETKQHESSNGLYDDFVFRSFRPNPDKNDCYEFENIYNIVLHTIKNRLYDTCSKELFLNLLESEKANLLAIGVYYLSQNIGDEIDKIFTLFTKDNFFISIDSSEILQYYSKELLAMSYPFLTKEQQQKINQAIISTKKSFRHWTHEDFYTKKKICSGYLSNTYSLISMIPEEYRNKYEEIKKIYQEGYRKYGSVTNFVPVSATVISGCRSYPQQAYTQMSFDDWKNTFRKHKVSSRSFFDRGKSSKEGNQHFFTECVSQNTDKFFPFVADIIADNTIDFDYILSGLEGLQKSNHSKTDLQQLCLKIITQRRSELNEDNLMAFLRVLRYIAQDNNELNKNLFNFVKEIIYQYPDRESEIVSTSEKEIEMKAIGMGINSIRGIAVEFLICCYALSHYKEEIFETLEYIADNANEATRACLIYRGAWLNHLDKHRAFDLYLRSVKDYNPLLLAIPFSEEHPLYFHICIDFKKLIPFFNRAITIKEAGKPMAFFLFRAYLLNKPNAFKLLKTLLHNNSQARQELVWMICSKILQNEKFSVKGWRILFYLLQFDDEKLGKQFNNGFMQIPPILNTNLTKFLNKFLISPNGKYRGNDFYIFLRKLIPLDASQCLKWFFASNPNDYKDDYYRTNPLNVLIEAYNGIRKYEKDNPLLERAIDTFDSLLQIPRYRNEHLRTFLQELSS